MIQQTLDVGLATTAAARNISCWEVRAEELLQLAQKLWVPR